MNLLISVISQFVQNSLIRDLYMIYALYMISLYQCSYMRSFTIITTYYDIVDSFNLMHAMCNKNKSKLLVFVYVTKRSSK